MGTLVLETPEGCFLLSYAQEGLAISGPSPRSALRWPTEPDLSMDDRAAEEWLEFGPLEDSTVPLFPLSVRTMRTWTAQGDYLAAAALSFSDGTAELVVTTTDSFDLECVDRAAATAYVTAVADGLALPVRQAVFSADRPPAD
ncbi:hypothetical protein [Actinoallomurus iriomotensis]|uniref:Uncharacterized protein n=1 Tax=Actinoallomurus iriomotensis TaxID=478107 RepID=A0A9W6S5D6_9ACTN|nr:hypothetical protein [Actinoallomurus iriomotensis]GLY87511.1 hypothetical protein Airi02_054400 [Actinoallomurus iriomotensis]